MPLTNGIIFIPPCSYVLGKIPANLGGWVRALAVDIHQKIILQKVSHANERGLHGF